MSEEQFGDNESDKEESTPEPIDIGLPFDIPSQYQPVIAEAKGENQSTQEAATIFALNAIHQLYVNNIHEEGIPSAYKDMMIAIQDQMGPQGRIQLFDLVMNQANNNFLQDQMVDEEEDEDEEEESDESE